MNHHEQKNDWVLALGALGVVFGDIGTSPLYALKECLAHQGAVGMAREELTRHLYGPVSLMTWSLAIMVALKYLTFVTKATAKGEGGIFALLSLLRSKKEALGTKSLQCILIFVLMGAALLYGDGMITPAISVLSAVEGLKLLNPNFAPYVIPIAVTILIGLFMVQSSGTAKIGKAFGPIMLVWFGCLATLGLWRFCQHPEVITALSPVHGITYLMEGGLHGIVIMGMVLLAVTGCEALYADVGHFGRMPLVKAWYLVVFPALILNYLGQASVVLNIEGAVKDPFFYLVPSSLMVPMIVLATLATIIASQALITGVYSLTQQAVQLGYLPRLKIIHTNPDMRGQIYMPQINFILMFFCVALVIGFKTSSNLAAVYGLSVSLDMTLTGILFYIVAVKIWGWSWWKLLAPFLVFLVIELGYVGGSLSKFMDGAWFALAMACLVWLLMKTWTDGRAILFEAMQRGRLPVDFLIAELKNDRIIRVPGTAVFMSATADGLPLALLHHLKHNKALHENVVLLSVKFLDEPKIDKEDRTVITDLYTQFHRVVLHYGFAESPDVFKDMCEAMKTYGKVKPAGITFYQSREVLLTNGPGKMALWRKKLFVVMSRISRPAVGYFSLPSRQCLELGIQLEL
jgi:KUP system potassium uptake protein